MLGSGHCASEVSFLNLHTPKLEHRQAIVNRSKASSKGRKRRLSRQRGQDHMSQLNKATHACWPKAYSCGSLSFPDIFVWG